MPIATSGQDGPSIKRSYYSASLEQFATDDENAILGELAANNEFALEEMQRDAWHEQIKILKRLKGIGPGHVMLEYSIPRMGRRVDAIIICSGLVFVIEFKVNATEYPRDAREQCYDYALDLKNFQGGSRDVPLVPLLVCTEAADRKSMPDVRNGVFGVIDANKRNLNGIMLDMIKSHGGKYIDPVQWEDSSYSPTPTIIEAARALYARHDVREISRSDAGARNLAVTSEAIDQIIKKSREEGRKSICFVTGVPGAGKTLAGLNIASKRRDEDESEHAVFLSGNGPLVQVLQEALARDGNKKGKKKGEARREAKAFIQNVHHFRDDAITDKKAPSERIVIFDEAQRAWDRNTTKNFMRRKKKVKVDQSEPNLLISAMNRHKSWAVIVCLVGGGQEINRGEAGIAEWFRTLNENFVGWDIYVPDAIEDAEYVGDHGIGELLDGMNEIKMPGLHLSTSIRAFRSENVSRFVKLLLDCEPEAARDLLRDMRGKYPIVLTRSLCTAKRWLEEKACGSERYGITASAKAQRLRPYGVYAGYDVNPPKWFLNSRDDLRSSYYLEYVATEFDIQGLELDWACVAWDGNFRHADGDWTYKEFRGTKWTNINSPENQTYLKNAYRVLLTRARQGMVVFIPEGDDGDPTRKREYYDHTYKYLKGIGISEIN